MAKILKLAVKPPSKFDYKRVKRVKKKNDPERLGQLSLFNQAAANIIPLEMHRPFEHALMLDESGDVQAARWYLKAIEESDCTADAYCNLGIIESKSGNTTKALDSFTKSLKHDPRLFEAHFNLGNLYFDSGDLSLAELHYDMAAEIDPRYPHLYFNLGLVLATLGEYGDAITALEKYQRLAEPEEAGKADDLLDNLRRSLAN